LGSSGLSDFLFSCSVYSGRRSLARCDFPVFSPSTIGSDAYVIFGLTIWTHPVSFSVFTTSSRVGEVGVYADENSHPFGPIFTRVCRLPLFFGRASSPRPFISLCSGHFPLIDAFLCSFALSFNAVLSTPAPRASQFFYFFWFHAFGDFYSWSFPIFPRCSLGLTHTPIFVCCFVITAHTPLTSRLVPSTLRIEESGRAVSCRIFLLSCLSSVSFNCPQTVLLGVHARLVADRLQQVLFYFASLVRQISM